eukprot:m.96682 g.96682  ORF g.96682 m.96682 type:complete len:63 (-) comp26914_c0_seq1:148-336(-)
MNSKHTVDAALSVIVLEIIVQYKDRKATAKLELKQTQPKKKQCNTPPQQHPTPIQQGLGLAV